MSIADNIIQTARREIGITEYPTNSNNVKYNTWYYGHAVSGSAYPWCMVFVQYVYDKSGYTLPYKTASCSLLLNWYKCHKPDRIVKTPVPGCIAIYNFGHTGIVVKDNGNGTITAIEGNTSASSSGSQSNGGGVFEKVRSKTTVTAYIKPFTEDDDMITQDKFNELMNNWLAEQRAKPESAWSVEEGAWRKARERDIVNTEQPQAFIKREEMIAVLDRLGLIK